MPTTATVLPALRRGDTYDSLTFKALETYPNDSKILAQIRDPNTKTLVLSWVATYADGYFTLPPLTPSQTSAIKTPGLYRAAVQITETSGRTKTQFDTQIRVLDDFCFNDAPPTADSTVLSADSINITADQG